ncbi:MAG: hypothetical protein GY838_05145 [bacterium]|nr:hypothetical protein [bacterium]
MRVVIMLLLCIALVGSAVAAEKTVTITPLKGPAQMAMQAPAGVCVFGNLNPVAYAIPDYMWGAESYATIFEAELPPCGCPEGFNVEAVHMYMNFDIEDVPVSFDVSASFMEATFDETAGCEIPGATICTSLTYTVTIETAGLYDVGIPLDPLTCGCAYFGYKYAVSMDIDTAFAEYPDAVTDEFPLGCVSWNNYGSGWIDTIDLGMPGELSMYADIVCCAPAVPVEDKAWGDVKSLFR